MTCTAIGAEFFSDPMNLALFFIVFGFIGFLYFLYYANRIRTANQFTGVAFFIGYLICYFNFYNPQNRVINNGMD